MVDVATFLRHHKCSVTAPAGCGKTQLIAQAIYEANAERVLVLTHTHAGVKSLRDRLFKLGVDKKKAHVDTIAGWCLRYAGAYKTSSELKTTEPVEKKEWYNVYDAAHLLLNINAICSVVKASYSAVYVDEYQDCTCRQHKVVKQLSTLLPCRILGDPLQGIFDFAGPRPSWKLVESDFPSIGCLKTPWRWKGKNDALGNWLLSIRKPLINGESIDLTKKHLNWIQNSPEYKMRELIKEPDSEVVAIAKWPRGAHEFAQSLGGLITSMEEIYCNDLLEFAKQLDSFVKCSESPVSKIQKEVFDLAKKCMTLRPEPENGEQNHKNDADDVKGCVYPLSSHDAAGILEAMKKYERSHGKTLFRRELWSEAKRMLQERMLQEKVRDSSASYREVAWRLRDRHRKRGRKIDRHVASRTLLIKGLEFQKALVLDKNEFNAKEFYVAVTRGAESLTVVSAEPEVTFAKPEM